MFGNIQPAPATGMDVFQMPARVSMAFSFIQFAQTIAHPYGDPQRECRELSKTEAEVYDSALVVLLEFFESPTHYTVGQPQPPDDQDPEQKQPVPVA